jgi:hypothetical protein
VEKIYRYHGDPIAAFDDFEQNRGDDGQPAWQPENWANPTTAALTPLPEGGNALKISFKGGDKMKAAAGKNVDLNLTGAKAIVLDLHSSMPHGFNVSLLFSTRPNWEGFESRPIFVRPGWNRNLRFPLDLDDFKSAKTEWKSYDTPFQPRATVGRIAFLLYNLTEAGEVQVDSLRVERD